MGDMSSGPGGVLYNTPSGPSGLFESLDPAYQRQQLSNQAAQLDLKRASAFQNGVPTLPDGSLDIDAMAKTQIQNGDAAGGLGLLMSGLKLQMLRDPSTVSNPTGQGGGTGGGGSAGGFAPASGGGMIAPAAGGDNYGRQAGGGYAAAGQVGVGGQGMPATAAPQGSAAAPGAAGSPSGGAGGVDPLDIYAHSIGALESNNQYDALGQKQNGGDRAYGRYQVMGANIPSWTKEVLGQAMTPADFLASPQAQDAVFKAKFGQAVQQYNNPFDAASVWFSGKPLARAGNASDSLGTTVPAYIQRFAAGLTPAMQALRGGQGGGGQPQAQGQPAIPSGGQPGGQAQPISFGGPAASAIPAASDPVAAARARLAAQSNANLDSLTPEQSAQRDDDVDTVQQAGSTTSSGAIGDAQVMQARKVIAATSGYDPASLAPGAQQALAAAKDTVARYLQEQNTPPTTAGASSAGTVAGAPTSSTTDAPKPGAHPYFPGGSGVKSAPATPPVGVSAGGGVQPGAPATAGAPPAMAPMAPGPQGGVQPVSFGGGAPQAAAAPSAPPNAVAAPAPGGMPPEVAAALQRLQTRQGSAADGALWGSYMKAVGGQVAGAGAPATGGMPARPMVPNGQGGTLGASPSSPYGAPPPSSSGPDLPYLQGKYAVPGGGAQYVADQLDQARRYGLAGEPQAAQAFIERAKQVQSDLQEVNKSRLDLQMHNAELTPEQKLFQTAQGQGFTGSYLDFQNALATGKANATAAGRNSQLTGGQKEYQQAVAGGFQGTEADYQAAAASQKAEAGKQGDYLGGLPAQYAQAADAGRAANDNVDQMLTAAQGFRMGAGAGIQQDARKALQGTLGFLGVSDPKLNDPTASYEDFGKMAGAHLRNVVSSISGPKGVQELQLVGSSLPSAEQSYDGFRAVSSSLKGSNDFAIARQQASQDWLADPAHRNSLSGFEASFNRNVSPSTFWLNRLRTDQPDLFAQSVQRLGSTDQGRLLLQKAKTGMAWAQQQGLF